MALTQERVARLPNAAPTAQNAAITVILPLRGAPDALADCLASLSRQTYPHPLLEIQFLFDSPALLLRKLVREFVKAHPDFRVRQRSAHAARKERRHIATSTESARLVLALQSNAILADDFIAQAVACAQASSAASVCGRVLYQKKDFWTEAYATVLGSHWTVPLATQDLTTEQARAEGCLHAVYREAALREAGVLPQEILSNEYETATRLHQKGQGLHFFPQLVSTLDWRGTLWHLLGHALQHGFSWAKRVKKQPALLRPHYVVPFILLVLAALFASGADFGSTRDLTWLGIATCGYLVCNVLMTVALVRRQRWRCLPIMPGLLFLFHIGFGLGTMVGVLTAKKWGSAVPKWIEKVAAICSDYIAITAAFMLWTQLRARLGLFALANFESAFAVSNLIFGFWFLLFLLLGLYRAWNAASRLDEAVAVFKIVGVGVLLIYLLTFELEQDFSQPLTKTRVLLLSYWFLVAGAVTTGRMILRTIQRHLLESGVGMRRTLIVGWGRKARELYQEVSKYPALGFQVLGFVEIKAHEGRRQFEGVPVLGRLEQLAEIARRHQIEEVLIALQQKDQRALMEIIAQTDGLPVGLKIVPDLYSIITGQARTNQIYGFPLIEILPQYMPTWERVAKRVLDFTLSLIILVLGAPVWLLVALIIKLDSRGPIFYKQERMGKDGRHFNVIKFRSMVSDAEKLTGPKWADKDDARITRSGRFMRKWRIDEIPQFINVLAGEMSIVGPRPERSFFVEKLRKEIPLYPRRLRVQPGITGWAQIKGAYDATLDDVKQKLQYDLFYLENMSLKMDLKIILHTIYVMLAGRGQ
ncbi:MAG: undecaprenyl-phosphate glucose phosphotransferase [candidate division KSB1 bacterium]